MNRQRRFLITAGLSLATSLGTMLALNYVENLEPKDPHIEAGKIAMFIGGAAMLPMALSYAILPETNDQIEPVNL